MTLSATVKAVLLINFRLSELFNICHSPQKYTIDSSSPQVLWKIAKGKSDILRPSVAGFHCGLPSVRFRRSMDFIKHTPEWQREPNWFCMCR